MLLDDFDVVVVTTVVLDVVPPADVVPLVEVVPPAEVVPLAEVVPTVVVDVHSGSTLVANWLR